MIETPQVVTPQILQTLVEIRDYIYFGSWERMRADLALRLKGCTFNKLKKNIERDLIIVSQIIRGEIIT